MAECVARINGIDVCYEVFGEESAPPLLLIMGLGGPMLWWDEEFCRALVGRGFRVIRFDNRDVGRSAAVPGAARLLRSYLRRHHDAPYSLADMAGDAAALLTHMEIPAAHVAGVSMGGMIAQILAIGSPDRVRSLTSISSSTGSRRVGWASPRVLAAMSRPLAAGEAAYVARNLEGFRRIGTARYRTANTERQRARARATFARGMNAEGTVRQVAAIVAAPDRTADLARLRLPACVIHGTMDPLVHVSGGLATARAIPGAELVLVPGMGHDMPPQLWPVLLDGIERTARRAGDFAPRRAAHSDR